MNLRPKLPNTTQVHVNENKIKICLTTIIIEEKKNSQYSSTCNTMPLPQQLLLLRPKVMH